MESQQAVSLRNARAEALKQPNTYECFFCKSIFKGHPHDEVELFDGTAAPICKSCSDDNIGSAAHEDEQECPTEQNSPAGWFNG